MTLVINPFIDYILIAKWESRTIQAVAIRVRGIIIKSIYISPAATAEEEEKVLLAIQEVSTGRAIVIGDVNARNKICDKKSSRRGRRLERWTKSIFGRLWHASHSPSRYVMRELM